MLLAISTMARFARYAILSCYNIYEVDICFSIPWSFKNWLNALEMNSLPLSDWKFLILYFNWISTSHLNSLNFSKQSPLDFNTYKHTFHEKSSMKVTKYIVSLMDIVFMGPQMSECTIFKALVICFSLHSETQPHVVCLRCTLHKATRMLGKKNCQGSYRSSCFEGNGHSSRSNGQGSGAKAQERHLPLEIGPSWSLPIHAPSQN